MRKVVISRIWPATDQRPVIGGDLAEALTALKNEEGDADILLACGPTTLGPLASAPGLVDEYVIAVHPAVLSAGPQLFDHFTANLTLELIEPSRLMPASSWSATRRCCREAAADLGRAVGRA